jgi:hypothetical protein
MRGHGTKFGRKKEEAIAALLTQRNIEEAAKATGIAPNTLLKWMKEPEFQAAYREARRAGFGQSVARLQQASGAAVSTLLKIMVDPNAPHSTRVRAADSVLDHAAKAAEIEDIEVRVTELERAAEQVKSSRGRADLVADHLHAVIQGPHGRATEGNPVWGCDGIVDDQGVQQDVGSLIRRPQPSSGAEPNALRALRRKHNIVVGDGGVLQRVAPGGAHSDT